MKTEFNFHMNRQIHTRFSAIKNIVIPYIIVITVILRGYISIYDRR